MRNAETIFAVIYNANLQFPTVVLVFGRRKEVKIGTTSRRRTTTRTSQTLILHVTCLSTSPAPLYSDHLYSVLLIAS